MTDLAQTTPNVIAEIRGQAFQEQLAAALPPGVTAERFARVAVTALLDDQIRQSDPAKQLLACDRASLYSAIIKCAQDGLLPDGRQAALVKRGKNAVYQPMVDGLRAIAARSGWTIRGTAVRARDEFDFTDEPPLLYHKVFTGGERGELVYAYAVARHRDGRREQRVMTREEVLKRAESATTQQVWEKWPDEMWAKTPVRDIYKELALDPAEYEQMARVLSLIQNSEPGAAAEALYGPQESEPALPPNDGSDQGAEVAHTESPASAPAPTADDEPGLVDEPATGELTDADLQALAVAAESYVPPSGKFSAAGEHGPKTLAEIADAGKTGQAWFRWALAAPSVAGVPEYAAAVTSYCRVFAPALYQEALAKRELA